MNLHYVESNFPKFERSYDSVHHKKVPNIHLAIPSGKKYYMWLTNYNGNDVCYLLEYNKKKNAIVNMKQVSVIYDKKLSYGTILYGTIVQQPRANFFVCENILHYLGKDVSQEPFGRILYYMNDLFRNYLKQMAYTNKEYIVALPLMGKTKTELMRKMNEESVPYFGILNRNTNSTASFMTLLNNTSSRNKIMNFTVMADNKHNVYNLYYFDNGLKFFQKTYIPDYKTTTVLNEEFRIIKEDYNLDLLEESDDEDEFENINDDKYVHQDKKINFKCYFHSKMKRWVPFEKTYDRRIANRNDIV